MTGNIEKLYDIKIETTAFKILCFLAFKDGHFKPSMISEAIGENPSTVRARLAELKNAGLVIASPDGYMSTLNPYDILMKLYLDIKNLL
jgi:DNA-binding transcriptional ArsR family regulator